MADLTPQDVDRLSQARAQRNRERQLRSFRLLWLATMLMCLGLAVAIQFQLASAERFSREQCEQRRVNTIRINDGYATLAAVADQDPTLAAPTRERMVAAYQKLALEVPV